MSGSQPIERLFLASVIQKLQERIEEAARLGQPAVKLDVRLWPTSLIKVAMRAIRRRGHLVQPSTDCDGAGRIVPALLVRLPVQQREFAFGSN